MTKILHLTYLNMPPFIRERGRNCNNWLLHRLLHLCLCQYKSTMPTPPWPCIMGDTWSITKCMIPSLTSLFTIFINQFPCLLIRISCGWPKTERTWFFISRFMCQSYLTFFGPSYGQVAFNGPRLKKPSDPASSLAFRQFMAHEQVRRHTSLTPSSNSQKQWVENNRSLLTDMNDLMAEVQKDDQHRVPIMHVDIISNTGVSQYLRAPVIQWNTTQRSTSDLRSLLKPAVGQSALTGERDTRSAAYLFWVIVQPVLLSSELNEIMQNTVVALKREGKQTFSSLATGQQGALQFALKPLRNMFSRALVKAFAFKHRLRVEVLGTLRPFPIYDVLLSSSLICPGLFPDSSWDEATNLLRQSMDSPSLHTWDGKAPAFNALPPARTRSFRDPPPFAQTAPPVYHSLACGHLRCPQPSPHQQPRWVQYPLLPGPGRSLL